MALLASVHPPSRNVLVYHLTYLGRDITGFKKLMQYIDS